MSPLRGHHVYHTFVTDAPLDVYHPIDLLAQLCSALHWKRSFGPIELVCDHHHLRELQTYGVEQVYDVVDTQTLTKMPVVDIRYWAFAKIFLARELSRRQPEAPVLILDTDLWLTRVPDLLAAPTAQLIGFHREDYDENYAHNPYLDPSLFLGQEPNGHDWSVLPLNTALLYVHHPELVEAWYELAWDVIVRNREVRPLGCSAEIVFIEQRLLPTLAASYGVSTETLIPATYHTAPHFGAGSNRSEWSAPELVPACLETMRHIWATKQHYDHLPTRTHVVELLLADLHAHFSAEELQPYETLMDDARALASPLPGRS